MADFKHITTNAVVCTAIMVFCYWIKSSAAVVPVFNTGDSYCSFFWTQTTNEVAKYGYYGITKITGVDQSGASTIYSAKFRVDRCSWWQSLVMNIYGNINFVFNNTKPDSIDLCSSKFAAVSWLRSITGATDSNAYSIRFYFPVLPKDQPYSRYDYFTVLFNDSMDVQFQGISDSIITGSFINKRIPGSTTMIYAKNAIAIQTTSANAFRIRSIQINGVYEKLVSSYLRFDLSALKKNAAYFGFNVIDTVIPDQVIQVKSVALSQASTLSADSTYRLTWSLSGASSVDRCSLSVSLDSGITWMSAGMTNGADTSVMWTAPHRESQHCFIKVLAIAQDGLKYFGLSQEFSIKINTPINSVIPPVNNYLLQGAALTPASVRLVWSINGPRDTAVHKIGIRYNTMHFPASMKDSLSDLAGVFGLSDTCDTILNLQQNQLYYFSLFVGNASDVWSAATQSSIVSVRTGMQPGLGITIGIDTQHVFSDSLLVWSQPKLLVPYSDTIDVWNGPLVKPGFIQTGPGFSFRQGTPPSSTTIGVGIAYGAIPQPFKASDQRVYQYDIYTGNWRINEGPITIDTVNHIVRAGLKDARLPFIVMIDTAPPVVDRRPNSQGFFTIEQRIIDTFFISDNIENVSLQLLAGPGNHDMGDISVYITPGEKPTQYIMTIPPYVADQCSGLRAFLKVGDGRNTETINLSENILRQGTNCDDAVAPAIQWTPLKVTAQPQNPLISAAVLTSAGQATPQAYDKAAERIIQWLPLPENGPDAKKWVEYSSANDSLFKLAPGKLFWIKSRDDRAIHYGNATVPSLRDTFAIPLNAGGWTDFSIPFNFDLYLGDIINATKQTYGSTVDSIEIYHWVKSGQSYKTEQVYLYGISNVGAPFDLIKGGDGYAAYNRLATPLGLRIPPIATAVSSVTNDMALSKKTTSGSWSVRIGISSGNTESLSPVYCASLPSGNKPRFYPMPPSFSSLRAGIIDQRDGHEYGSAASGDLSQGGTFFQILCENTASETRPLTFSIEKITGLSQDMKAGFFAGTSGKSAVVASLSVLLSSLHKSTQYFIVGNDKYITNITRLFASTLSFHAFAYNRGIRIVYTVPYNTIVMELAMFDLRGRRIWKKQVTAELLPNTGSFLLSNSFACGYYIIEMKAFVKGEAQPHFLNQKVIYVR